MEQKDKERRTVSLTISRACFVLTLWFDQNSFRRGLKRKGADDKEREDSNQKVWLTSLGVLYPHCFRSVSACSGGRR
jgi:hypothetical protein